MNEKWVDRGPYSKIMEGVAPETPAFVDFGEWEPVRAKDFLPALASATVRQLAHSLDTAVKALRGETKESETERVESLEPMTVDASLLPELPDVSGIIASPKAKKALPVVLVLSQLALALRGAGAVEVVHAQEPCLKVDDLGGCINEDLWDKQIAPGIVRTTIVEPGFSRDGVNSGTLQGHTTMDVRNRGKEVVVGGPDGKLGIIYNELSGQMRILGSDGQVVDKWSWSKVTVQFPDGSTQAFDSIMVGPR